MGGQSGAVVPLFILLLTIAAFASWQTYRLWRREDERQDAQKRESLARGQASHLNERLETARRELEMAEETLRTIRARNDLLAEIVDGLPLPIWRRRKNLDIEYCNLAYAAAVELPRDAVLQEGTELPDGPYADISRKVARAALKSATMMSERHHVVIGEDRRLLEVVEVPISPETTIGYAIDQTDAEAAELKLQRHVSAHEEVLENLGSAIAIFGEGLKLLFHNRAYAALLELDEGFLSTKPHFGDVLEQLRNARKLPEEPDFPAFKQASIARFRRLIESGEEMLHLPDGSTLRMTYAPYPFGGVVLTYEDVTDRLALERSYNTLIEVQRETLDHLYEGVAVFLSDGRLKLFNPAYARMWQLSSEALAGEPHMREVLNLARRFFDVSDEVWPETAERIIARSTERDARSGRFERVDGTVLIWSQVPLPDGAALFTFLDVSDSIKVERALRERNEALETADRLKSEFIANVSYELRTPLNAIVGFAEILEKQFFGPLNERQLEYSHAIVESSQRLIALINDILDLATIEAGYLKLDLAPFEVRALLDSIFGLGQERARNLGITLEVDCAPDVGRVIADERRLKQALFNLLSNALKFTPEGGRVALGARAAESELLLSVSDTGVGIPPEEQSRVFGRFENIIVRGRQSGAGLGLSLVKSLVELHGGWVELKSTPGRGTNVTCHIPLARPV